MADGCEQPEPRYLKRKRPDFTKSTAIYISDDNVEEKTEEEKHTLIKAAKNKAIKNINNNVPSGAAGENRPNKRKRTTIINRDPGVLAIPAIKSTTS